MNIQLTPTQSRLLKKLSDGEPHHGVDLIRECINDELASRLVLRVHLCKLRKKLKPEGYDIVCVWGNGAYRYRLIKVVSAGDIDVPEPSSQGRKERGEKRS